MVPLYFMESQSEMRMEGGRQHGDEPAELVAKKVLH